MRVVLWLAVALAAAFGVFVAASPAPKADAQMTSGRGVLSPSCIVEARRGDVRDWPIQQPVVTLYEYAKGAVVTEVDGNWYALNGLARMWFRRENMLVKGRLLPVREMDTLPTGTPGKAGEDRSVMFLSQLNDVASRRCPS